MQGEWLILRRALCQDSQTQLQWMELVRNTHIERGRSKTEILRATGSLNNRVSCNWHRKQHAQCLL